MPDECEQFLTALFSGYPAGTHVELRLRTDSGMARAFYGVDRLHDVAVAITHYALRTDVYVGVLARQRQASAHRDVVRHAHVIWADCDTPEAVATLAQFSPEPAIIVSSGSGDNRHAYWFLDEPVPLGDIEIANRRLAQLLGADERCADAARILRPPSLNHKHDPPQDVRLLRCEPLRRHRVDAIVGAVDRVSAVPRSRCGSQTNRNVDDPLLAIEPARFVEELAGVAVPRNRKVRCPFHDDRTPSLHVYDDPARGWCCFGCGRGGSIYDFAALLWGGLQTRGTDFVELRRRLDLLFDHTDLAIA
jgi:CHC2 zinc finger/RepB DNA-primase from phage plasmid